MENFLMIDEERLIDCANLLKTNANKVSQTLLKMINSNKGSIEELKNCIDLLDNIHSVAVGLEKQDNLEMASALAFNEDTINKIK